MSVLDNCFNTNNFHANGWDPTNPNQVHYSAEASELPRNCPPYGSKTKTIKVQSLKTGRIVEFELVRTLYDASGEDVLGWHYSQLVDGKFINVVIYND